MFSSAHARMFGRTLMLTAAIIAAPEAPSSSRESVRTFTLRAAARIARIARDRAAPPPSRTSCGIDPEAR